MAAQVTWSKAFVAPAQAWDGAQQQEDAAASSTRQPKIKKSIRLLVR